VKGEISMTRKKYIHIVIMLLLTIGICLCPPFGAISPTGMRTIGVFVGVLYGWMTIDLIWPSIFGYVALAITGVTDTTTALSSGFGNTQLVQVLTVMVLAGALDSVGVTKLIANWMLTRNLFRKNPWILICGIIFTSYVLGISGAAIAGIMVLWAVVMQIAEKEQLPKGDILISFMIIMITAANFSGMFTLPFHATTMIFLGYFIEATGLNYPTAEFILVAVVTTILVLILMILFAKFILRIDASKFIMQDEAVEKMKNEPVEKKAKIGFIVLIIYMLALILPSCFESMPGAAMANRLGIGGWSLLAMLILSAISLEGKSLFSLAKTWSRYVEWPLILLLSVTFPIAEAMRASDAGIMPTLMGIVLPIVSHMGIMTFMLVTMVLLGTLTQFTHNIVLAAMFIPFLCPLCVQLGGNPYVLWFLIFFSLNASYMTPAASFQSAMVHGHEFMGTKWGYIFGIAFSIITWIVLGTVTIPIANALFVM